MRKAIKKYLLIHVGISISVGNLYANTVIGWDNSLDSLSTGNTINGFENTLKNSNNNNIGNKCNVVNDGNGSTTTYCITHKVDMTDSNNNTLTGYGNSTITNSNYNEFHMTGGIINNTNNTKTNGDNLNLNYVKDSDITGTYTNVYNGTNITTVGTYNTIEYSFNINISGVNENYINGYLHSGNHNTVISSYDVTIVGDYNNNTAASNVTIKGDYNTNDTGSNNTITGNNNFVYYGDNNVVTGNTTTVIGGNNLAGSNLSTENAVTVGNNVTVDGVNSIGFGNNTIASNGGIAIGSGSNASRNDEVNIGDRNITGVKNGVANNDSINVSQLNETMANTDKSANNYTDEKLQSGYTETTDYTDQRINEVLNSGLNDFTSEYANGKIHLLNKKADKTQKHIYAGISSAIATASVPHREHKKYSFGVGVGSYRKEVSGALGVRVGLTKNIAVGSTLTVNTQNDTALAVSFAYGF